MILTKTLCTLESSQTVPVLHPASHLEVSGVLGVGWLAPFTLPLFLVWYSLVSPLIFGSLNMGQNVQAVPMDQMVLHMHPQSLRVYGGSPPLWEDSLRSLCLLFGVLL